MWCIIYFVAALDAIKRCGEYQLGSIAQLGEHLPYKQGVTGSSPVVPTKFYNQELEYAGMAQW